MYQSHGSDGMLFDAKLRARPHARRHFLSEPGRLVDPGFPVAGGDWGVQLMIREWILPLVILNGIL